MCQFFFFNDTPTTEFYTYCHTPSRPDALPIAGAGTIFFAYLGFDAVSTAAEETRNPQRDLPIGILGSLAICTVLYIVVSLLLTGMVSYRDLNVPYPVASALLRSEERRVGKEGVRTCRSR